MDRKSVITLSETDTRALVRMLIDIQSLYESKGHFPDARHAEQIRALIKDAGFRTPELGKS